MEGIKNKMEILEIKNNWNLKITEMKNLNRMEMPEKRISEIEDKQIEIIQYEQQREKKIGKKVEQSLRDLWDTNKSSTIHAIGVPEGEE